MQTGHAIAILSRLSCYEDSKGNWDREIVKKTIDYVETCDKLLKKMDETHQWLETEQRGPSESFLTFKKLISERVGQFQAAYLLRQGTIATAPQSDESLVDAAMAQYPFCEIFSFGPNDDIFNWSYMMDQ